MRRIRKVAWASLDQGLSSFSNLLVSVFAARAGDVEAFGVFAVFFTVYQFGLGASRALVGEPTLVRFSGHGKPESSRARGTLGASFVLGLVGSAACLLLWAIFRDHSEIFLIAAIGFPVLMLADGVRYIEFAARRPHVAAMLDLMWLIIQVVAYVLIILNLGASVSAVILSWVVGAATLVLAYGVAERAYPSVKLGVAWLASNRDLAGRFFTEYLAISGVQQSVVYFSVVFAGVSAAGAIRGAQVATGPLSIFSMGVAVVALPALVARTRVANASVRLRRLSFLVSLALFVVTAAYALMVLALPDQLGTALLGASWHDASGLIPLVLLQLAVSNLAYGATAGLRAMQEARLSLRLRLTTLPIALGAVIVGAWLGGPAGALVGAILGGSVQLVSWWSAYLWVTSSRKSLG